GQRTVRHRSKRLARREMMAGSMAKRRQVGLKVGSVRRHGAQIRPIRGWTSPYARGALFDFEQIDDEDQCFVRADFWRRAGWPVGKVAGYDQLAAAADLHAFDALVPAFDHFSAAQIEAEGFAPAP